MKIRPVTNQPIEIIENERHFARHVSNLSRAAPKIDASQPPLPGRMYSWYKRMRRERRLLKESDNRKLLLISAHHENFDRRKTGRSTGQRKLKKKNKDRRLTWGHDIVSIETTMIDSDTFGQPRASLATFALTKSLYPGNTKNHSSIGIDRLTRSNDAIPRACLQEERIIFKTKPLDQVYDESSTMLTGFSINDATTSSERP